MDDATGPIRRPEHTVEGDEKTATARDDVAEGRDRRAERRDEVADARDAAADDRDRAATGGNATTFDRSPEESAAGDTPAAVSDRTAASWNRTAAKGDRGEAAHDRYAAAADRDASAHERAAASLDELTGAHRRGAGFMELDREVARAHRTEQPLVLAFVDVDGLKEINDSRGHLAGDRVLREVVSTLRTKLRSYDLIVRFGGDEFLCAIPGVSLAEAEERLAAVNTVLTAFPAHASVTTGLADLAADDSLEDLIARADAALYQQRHQRSVDLTATDKAPTRSS
jgi:diguanylate cyclase (GGDEF)-like protein